MLSISRVTIAAVTACVALAVALPAEAANVSPLPKFSAGGWAREPNLAADAAGRGTAVWDTGAGVIKSSTFSGSSWTCPVTLPASTDALVYSGASWGLDVADNGNAVFGGTLTNRGVAIWTRAGANGAWKKVTWSDPNAVAVLDELGPPRVTVTGGVAFAAWDAGHPGDGTLGIYGAQIPVGSTGPIAVTPLIVSDGVMGQDVDVAVDANGNSLAMILVGDNNGTWLDEVIWPRGGTPTVARTIGDIQPTDDSNSAHANASGQLIAMWTHLGQDNHVDIMAGTGTVTSGVTSETVWRSNDDWLWTQTIGSDISTNGNSAMMQIDQTGSIATGVGNASGGPAALMPTWTGAAPSGSALNGEIDVVTTDSQAWVAYGNDVDSAFLSRITTAGLTTAAQRTEMVSLSAAVVKVGKDLTGAMFGEIDGQSRLGSTLPTTIKPPAGKKKC